MTEDCVRFNSSRYFKYISSAIEKNTVNTGNFYFHQTYIYKYTGHGKFNRRQAMGQAFSRSPIIIIIIIIIIIFLLLISGFRRKVDAICALLGY